MKGYVYILSNECMPGIVKIGQTSRRVEARADELYQTGVPVPFKVEFEALVPDAADAEAIAHSRLNKARVSPGREFFRCPVDEAIREIEDIQRMQVEGIVEEFMTGFVMVEEPFYIDPAFLYVIASIINRDPASIAGIIGEIKSTDQDFDLRVLADRYDRRIGERRRSREDLIRRAFPEADGAVN